MNFEFREARDVSDEIKKFIFQNPKSYNFGNKSNINEPIVLPEGSKVYECYFKENLVAFIILVHCFKRMRRLRIIIFMKLYLVN